jgi:hypothetical protein
MGLFKEGRLFTFPTFIAAVFGLGFGASVFLNVQQHSRAAQDAKLMQGTITDLRYQVDQDHKQLAGGAATPAATPEESPLATPEPSASPAPTPGQVAGASTASPTLVKACNLHASASTASAIIVKYTSFTNLPLPVSLNGGQASGFQNITVNGKTGYVQVSCLSS